MGLAASVHLLDPAARRDDVDPAPARGVPGLSAAEGGGGVYIPQHAPSGNLRFYTSFIQTTAMLGLILASSFVVCLRTLMDAETFNEWGWRLPFIFSILLLGVTMWIRLQLEESPVFQRMKAAGATSKAPLKEAFGEWRNLKIVLIALFGAVAGQAVIGFAAHL